jgi:hypothetical protein
MIAKGATVVAAAAPLAVAPELSGTPHAAARALI